MPAVKHATKKAAKKTAKKAAKKALAHREGHDVRRAYEHLSRVRTLHLGLQPEAIAELETLTNAAQSAMHGNDERSSADLLRAAEHVAFAYLSPAREEEGLSPRLVASARAEQQHLLERAKEHDLSGKGASTLKRLHANLVRESTAALRVSAFHRALEFARAAEALTKVTVPQGKLPSGSGEHTTLRLR